MRSSRSCHDLGEAVPGLCAVADDGEASRRAAQQQHLPFRVGQLLRLVDDDVCERTGEQVGVRRPHGGLVDQTVLGVLPAQHRHQQQLAVVGRDEIIDDPFVALALGGDLGLVSAPSL